MVICFSRWYQRPVIAIRGLMSSEKSPNQSGPSISVQCRFPWNNAKVREA